MTCWLVLRKMTDIEVVKKYNAGKEDTTLRQRMRVGSKNILPEDSYSIESPEGLPTVEGIH